MSEVISSGEMQRTVAQNWKRKMVVDDEWCLIPRDWWETFCEYCGLNPNNPELFLEEKSLTKPGKINYADLVKGAGYLYKDEIKDGKSERYDYEFIPSLVYEYLKLWGYCDTSEYELKDGIRRKVYSKGGGETSIDVRPFSVKLVEVKDSEWSLPKRTRLLRRSELAALSKKYKDVYKKNDIRYWYLADNWELIEQERLTNPLDDMYPFMKRKDDDKWISIMIDFKHNGKWSYKWKNTLTVGTIIDVEDYTGIWIEAEILIVEENRIRVHFLKWSHRWDEWIGKNSKKIEDRGKHTNKHTARSNQYSTPSWRNDRKNSLGAPKICGAVGLRNLGNTCFMNSTLQCLSNTPGLTPYFRDDVYKGEVNVDNPLGWKGQLANAYADLIKEMWGNKYKTVAPTKFKAAIGKVQPRFDGYQQHDSSELLQFLLDGLHEDLNRVKKKQYTQVVESKGRPDDEVAKEAWARHLVRNKSIIVDLCQGQLKSRVVCPECSYQSITFDPFMFLSVPVLDSRNPVPLNDCFIEFSKEETLSETEAWYCSKCKKHQCARKKIDVWSLPDTLIIHLKRFCFSERSRNKIESMVDFPTHGLDMSQWTVDKNVEQKNCMYDLFAVSNHSGNCGGGHYTAHAQNLTDNNWYYLNDSSVSGANANASKTRNAYVLFYQRRASKKSASAKKPASEKTTISISSTISTSTNVITTATATKDATMATITTLTMAQSPATEMAQSPAIEL